MAQNIKKIDSIAFDVLCHELIYKLQVFKQEYPNNEQYCNQLIDYVKKEAETNKSKNLSDSRSWKSVAANLWKILSYYFDIRFDASLEDSDLEKIYADYIDSIGDLFPETDHEERHY
jgi:hypothetical protein